MINEVDNGSLNDPKLVPEEGQRGPLSTNKKSFRCPSFGFNNQFATEDDALEYLADILVEAFIEQKRYEHTQQNHQ